MFFLGLFCLTLLGFENSSSRKTALFLRKHRLKKYKNLLPRCLMKGAKMLNVENCNFSKVNCGLLLVIWVKWKQLECSITLLYSSTFYSLFLPLFVLKIFKVWHIFQISISKFDWFEQPGRVGWEKLDLDKAQLLSRRNSIPWIFNQQSCLMIFVSLLIVESTKTYDIGI